MTSVYSLRYGSVRARHAASAVLGRTAEEFWCRPSNRSNPVVDGRIGGDLQVYFMVHEAATDYTPHHQHQLTVQRVHLGNLLNTVEHQITTNQLSTSPYTAATAVQRVYCT